MLQIYHECKQENIYYMKLYIVQYVPNNDHTALNGLLPCSEMQWNYLVRFRHKK